jgi:hypothetical protein
MYHMDFIVSINILCWIFIVVLYNTFRMCNQLYYYNCDCDCDCVYIVMVIVIM